MAKKKIKAAKKVVSKPAKKSAQKSAKKVKKTAAKKQAVKKPSAKKAITKKPAVKKTASKRPAVSKQTSKTVVVKVNPLDLAGYISPLDDRVVIYIKPVTEKVTAGGIILPDTMENWTDHQKGTIVAVGRGHQDEHGHFLPTEVKVGDEVVITLWTGMKTQILGHDVYIARESDLLGIVQKG